MTQITHLDLHIKHSRGVNLQPKRNIHIMRKPFLISLLHLCPFFSERGVLDVRQKAFDFREVFEPNSFGKLKLVGDEGA